MGNFYVKLKKVYVKENTTFYDVAIGQNSF